MADGATPDRDDVAEVNTDPCIRLHEDGPKRMGKHAWIWVDLLQIRECTTCGKRMRKVGSNYVEVERG